MEAQENEPNWKNMVFYGVAWFIACLLLILALLNTFELVGDILNWIAASIRDIQKQRDFGWTITTIKEAMFFVGGCIAVAFAIGIEYYFRLGEKKGKLFQRIFKAVGIEIGVIVVSLVARILILKFGF